MSEFDDGESTSESAAFSTPSASSADISTTGSMSIISSGSGPAADTGSPAEVTSLADEHLDEEESDVPDSLPSSSDTDSDFDDDDGASDAEREWKESLQQLQLMLSMVIVPYMGRYFGRKCAYWGESPSYDRPAASTWSPRPSVARTSLARRPWDTPLTVVPFWASCKAGWKRWMEWRYPVEVVVTSRLAFEGAGAVAAAAAL